MAKSKPCIIWPGGPREGGWEVNAAERQAVLARELLMVSALEAVLLFHSGQPWTEDTALFWERMTGTREATTKTLCDCVRRALSMGGEQ